jgi:hypothetical protein
MSTISGISAQADCLQKASFDADVDQFSARLHAISDDVDLIDVAATSHREINRVVGALTDLLPGSAVLEELADQLCSVSRELYERANEATLRTEAAENALWNGPPTFLVDAELHRQRCRFLLAWFPNGRFDDVDDFVAGTDERTVTISPADCWRIDTDGARRFGVGLSALRAFMLDEPHHAFVARAAMKLGIPAAAAKCGVI